jgi:hypothetical protein
LVLGLLSYEDQNRVCISRLGIEDGHGAYKLRLGGAGGYIYIYIYSGRETGDRDGRGRGFEEENYHWFLGCCHMKIKTEYVYHA